MEERKSTPWFAAKRWGYGASWPIRWQGWLALALFILAIAGAAHFLTGLERLVATVGSILLFVAVTALKTEGGWRWRWGGD
jgi:hypothetical protein